MGDRVAHREGPRLIASGLGLSPSTIHAVLRCRGLAHLRDLNRPTGAPIRYERDCPRELVHVDMKKVPKAPVGGGWRIHGRGKTGRNQRGWLPMGSLRCGRPQPLRVFGDPRQPKKRTCAGFMLRAAQTFAQRGYRIDSGSDRQRVRLPQRSRRVGGCSVRVTACALVVAASGAGAAWLRRVGCADRAGFEAVGCLGAGGGAHRFGRLAVWSPPANVG